MPELPDVEIFRRHLARNSLHAAIRRVRVLDPSMLHGVAERTLTRALRGQSLVATHRHGKHLLVDLSDEGVLVLHFGMTGFLATGQGRWDGPGGHDRLVLELADSRWLVLVDQRRLGRIALAGSAQEYVAREDLGPDALSLSPSELRDVLRSSRGGVKATLTDQSVLAGLGNIYADEVLFHARVDPRAAAKSLEAAAYRRLHRQLHRVVSVAVDREADPDRMPRTWLLPRREDGVACPRGQGTVRKYRSGGRTGYWCPSCQHG